MSAGVGFLQTPESNHAHDHVCCQDPISENVMMQWSNRALFYENKLRVVDIVFRATVLVLYIRRSPGKAIVYK